MGAANRYGLMLHLPTTTFYGEVVSWSTLALMRQVGRIGMLTLTLPGDTYPLAFWQRDMQLSVMRSVEGAAPYLEGETRWFLRKWSEKKTRKERLTTLTFLDANCLLARRGVGYAAGSAQAKKTGAVDDVMKAVFRENYGSLATDTARDISTWVGCEADMSLLPSDSMGFAWRNVLRVMQDITDGMETYGAFDVVWSDGVGFEFRTYAAQRGVDLRTLMEVSEDVGNLGEPEITFDYMNEVTHVIALGAGEETEREIETASDEQRAGASPFNRHEVYLDCRQVDAGDHVSLQAEADRELAAGAGYVSLNGRIAEMPGCRYGYDYQFGSYVMVRHAGYTLPCHVDQVALMVNAKGKETIDAKFSGQVI